MKIAFLTNNLAKTGPNIQLLNLVQELVKIQNMQIAVFTLTGEPKNSLIEDFKIMVQVFCYKIKYSQIMKKKYTDIYNKLNEFSPDIIHSQCMRADYLSAKMAHITPKICTVHCCMGLDYCYTYGTAMGLVMKVMHSKAVKSLNQCICVSESVRQYSKKHLQIHNSISIKNGVNTEIYKPCSVEEKKQQKIKLGIPDDKMILISSGNLCRGKDPLWLANTFMQTTHQHKSVLIFLGDGELLNDMKLKFKENKNLIFPGRVNNIIEYLQVGDVFVSASKTEGFPMAAIEALSCGLPAVLSNIEPHIELSEAAGSCWIYDKANPRTFAAALDKIMDMNLNELKENARKIAIGSLSSAIMAEKYFQVYQSALNKRV